MAEPHAACPGPAASLVQCWDKGRESDRSPWTGHLGVRVAGRGSASVEVTVLASADPPMAGRPEDASPSLGVGRTPQGPPQPARGPAQRRWGQGATHLSGRSRRASAHTHRGQAGRTLPPALSAAGHGVHGDRARPGPEPRARLPTAVTRLLPRLSYSHTERVTGLEASLARCDLVSTQSHMQRPHLQTGSPP